MDKTVANGNRVSGVYSEDDVIVIDSDSEDESPSPKKPEPSLEQQIVDIFGDDDEQVDVNDLDLIWGSYVTDQPSTSGANKIKRPQYNLESSSSDEDSPIEYTEATPKVNRIIQETPKYSKPVVPVARIVPQLPKVEVIRKNSELERKEVVHKVHQIQNQPKKVAFVQPKVKHATSVHKFIHKKPTTKTVKPSVYMPLTVQPKTVGLRDQIRQKFNLANSASNFSLNSSDRMNSHARAQRILHSAKKKAIEKKSPVKTSVNLPPVKDHSRVKPAVASNVPNTSRMGFLLNATEKGVEIEKKPFINRDPRLNRPSSVNPLKSVTSNATAKPPSDVLVAPSTTSSASSEIQRSTSDFLADIRQRKIIVTNSTVVSDRHKKVKHRDSDYDINDVIRAKRLKREQEANSRTSNLSKNDKDDKEKEKEKRSTNSMKSIENNAKHSGTAIMQFSRSTSVSPKPVSADSVLIKILNWKPNWVQECENQIEPPPIVAEPLKNLKKSYESVDEYIQYYVPLLLHEIWAQLLDKFNCWNDSVVNVAMVQCEMIGDFAVVFCQFAVRKDQNYPKDGDLVCVEIPFWEKLPDKTEQRRRMQAFGYISDHTVEKITRKTSFACNYKPPDGCYYVVKYDIRLKPRKHRLDFNSLMKVKTVSYLKPMIRNAEALLSLKQSSLCCDILKPRKMTCQIVTPTAVKLESNDYNESQYKAILGSVEAISRPFSVPKLLLIQGPPGTGKTHTLVGMIKKIFSDYSKNPTTPKVLVCAPSNGAIDEIGKRLARNRKCFNDRVLRLVRIGQEKYIHPEMQKFSLETLAEHNIRSSMSDTRKNREAKMKSLEDRFAALDQELANHRATGNFEELKKCEKEMHRVSTEMKSVENGKFEDSDSDFDKKKRRLKQDLLMKADVILSTLNSCRSNLLEQIFNNSKTENGSHGCYGSHSSLPDQFTCVIIDEASQCTEPEILMPLIYTSISKMILIGDPMQLPATVMSKEAARHKFGTSLFERLYSYFGNTESESPILMLDTQYRMHPEICSFPSKRFYGNTLTTCPSVNRRQFPLQPYVVFNVIHTAHNKKDPKNVFNENEAQFVMKLLTAIGDCVEPSTSVGIITPYNGQKKLLEQKISQLKPNLVPKINTIDGFQGQEMDVIILSCVRSMDGDNANIGFLNSFQRINVALTRAKFMLVVCVSAKTLRNNELWNCLIEDATARGCLKNSAAQTSIEKIKQCIKL